MWAAPGGEAPIHRNVSRAARFGLPSWPSGAYCDPPPIKLTGANRRRHIAHVALADLVAGAVTVSTTQQYQPHAARADQRVMCKTPAFLAMTASCQRLHVTTLLSSTCHAGFVSSRGWKPHPWWSTPEVSSSYPPPALRRARERRAEAAGRGGLGWLFGPSRPTDCLVTPFTEVLDWSGAPFAKWFVGGELQRRLQLCGSRRAAMESGRHPRKAIDRRPARADLFDLRHERGIKAANITTTSVW